MLPCLQGHRGAVGTSKSTCGSFDLYQGIKEFTAGLIVPKSFPHGKERRADARLTIC